MKTERSDVIVIGGGHAGAESAWAAANLGAAVALVTMDPAKVGAMSCNPAIGGLAKGQIVREVDALGGLMGLAIDATGIQFRVLNASKGAAVRGPRAQADKYRYAREVQRLLSTRQNITTLAGTVQDIVVKGGRAVGVRFRAWREGAPSDHTRVIQADAVVLTTGTFMRGLMHTGHVKTPGGRVGEAPANTISDTLRAMGFELGRLKTGTPPRLDARTIDFNSLEPQLGDPDPQPFSDMTDPGTFPALPQRPCHITHTDQAIHDLIRDNLDRAPMYNGQIETAGPRYCPSIEDKVVRFADKHSHHVFLEPEGLDTHEVYCNGISTSLPADVQDQLVALLPGCERATILRHGYAVEYDMVWPHQIDATAMTKRVEGLFLAGQINGTSGYEEAAGQGLIAGLNAVRYTRDEVLIRLRRDKAYIGVLMDDLVTKTPREPYRMFTSRAEHRLLLRADNADQRLTPLGKEWGLVDCDRWAAFEQRKAAYDHIHTTLAERSRRGGPGLDHLRRPDTDARWVIETLATGPLPRTHDRRLIDRLLADHQYAGYIERQHREVEKLAKQENKPLPNPYDYQRVTGLRNEAVHTLNHFQPSTVGQAGRLAGITPADLMLLTVTVGR